MVTNKWQKFTRFAVTRENLERLAGYCDEFLVHGVDAEVWLLRIAQTGKVVVDSSHMRYFCTESHLSKRCP